MRKMFGFDMDESFVWCQDENEDRITELEHRLDTIENKLDFIIFNLEKEQMKLTKHIDFVENIYNSIKYPFHFFLDVINEVEIVFRLFFSICSSGRFKDDFFCKDKLGEDELDEDELEGKDKLGEDELECKK
jgi:hypothetical protein